MDVGIDIEEVSRIENAINRHPNFKNRVFSKREISYCESKKNPYPSYAARFSAKEAIRKATNQPYPLKEIEILNDTSGKPRVFIKGKSADHIKISISHTNTYATAVAVIEP